MMENDVLTMRICKDIIGSNWFLRIGAVRAIKEGRTAQGMAGDGGACEDLDVLRRAERVQVL